MYEKMNPYIGGGHVAGRLEAWVCGDTNDGTIKHVSFTLECGAENGYVVGDSGCNK